MINPVIIIPAYNHATQLLRVLPSLLRLRTGLIIVNDGSTDRTRATLLDFCKSHPDHDITILHHAKNLGKAAAMRTGFAEAARHGFTHAVTIDADGQLDPADIPKLLKASRANPLALILGTRPESIPGCPPRCSVGRHHAGLAVFAQTGRRLSDTQCGLRVYPLELLDEIRCHAGRFAFEAEIITRSIWAGREIVEVPVSCSYQPEGGRVSHFLPYRDSFRQGFTHVRLLGRALLPWTHLADSANTASASRGPFHRFLGWLNPFRCWRDIRDSDVGSLEFGIAVGLGAWIGTLPFFGLHTAMSLYVAWRLHLRPSAMVLGSQISIPPIGAVLAIVSFSVGHILITGALPSLEGLEFEWASITAATWHFFLAWLLGSVIVGFLIGLTLFGALQVLLPRFRINGDLSPAQSSESEPVIDPDSPQPTTPEPGEQPR